MCASRAYFWKHVVKTCENYSLWVKQLAKWNRCQNHVASWIHAQLSLKFKVLVLQQSPTDPSRSSWASLCPILHSTTLPSCQKMRGLAECSVGNWAFCPLLLKWQDAMNIVFAEPSSFSKESAGFHRHEDILAERCGFDSTSWRILFQEQLGWKWDLSFKKLFHTIFLFACEDDCGYESQPGRKDRKEIHYQYHDMACVKGAKWMPLGNYVGADIAMTMRYEWFALWLDYSKNRARARVNWGH